MIERFADKDCSAELAIMDKYIRELSAGGFLGRSLPERSEADCALTDSLIAVTIADAAYAISQCCFWYD